MYNWQNNPYLMQLMAQQQQQPQQGMLSSALQGTKMMPVGQQLNPAIVNPIRQPVAMPTVLPNQPAINPAIVNPIRPGMQQGTFTPVGTVNQPFRGFSRFPDYQQRGYGQPMQQFPWNQRNLLK